MGAIFEKELTELLKDSKRRKILIGKLCKDFKIKHHEADDLIFEAAGYLLLKDAQGSLKKPIRNIDAYVVTTARNKFVDSIRESKKHRDHYTDLSEDYLDDSEIDLFEENSENKRIWEEYLEYILKNIEKLEPDEISRDILLGFYCDKKSIKKIQEELLERGIDMTRDALRQRKRRSLKKIREKILEKYPNS